MITTELAPGDYVTEFADTVTSVRPSGRRSGVYEVTFSKQPGSFHLFFADFHHVVRPAEGETVSDEAKQAADEDEDSRW